MSTQCQHAKFLSLYFFQVLQVSHVRRVLPVWHWCYDKASVKRERELRSENLHESFLNSHAPVKREQELMRVEKWEFVWEFSQLSCPGQTRTRVAWEVMRIESLHESFLNSHAPVKREQELHERWWELRVCMRVFLNLMPPGVQTRTRVAWESMRVDWILARAWRKLSSRSVLFP
jgi:hypothetical protein